MQDILKYTCKIALLKISTLKMYIVLLVIFMSKTILQYAKQYISSFS